MPFFARGASAQSAGTIDAGTTITVRTNEQINAGNSDGRVFSGVVEQDVADRSLRSSRWTKGQSLRDYQAGYSSAYDGVSSSFQQGNGSVRVGSDNNISWQGPANSHLYVQVDNNPRRLFAAGASGVQPAPWMTSGHLYVFVLQDPNGNEIARDQADLRQGRSYRSR
jgi:hypothetical protein